MRPAAAGSALIRPLLLLLALGRPMLQLLQADFLPQTAVAAAATCQWFAAAAAAAECPATDVTAAAAHKQRATAITALSCLAVGAAATAAAAVARVHVDLAGAAAVARVHVDLAGAAAAAAVARAAVLEAMQLLARLEHLQGAAADDVDTVAAYSAAAGMFARCQGPAALQGAAAAVSPARIGPTAAAAAALVDQLPQLPLPLQLLPAVLHHMLALAAALLWCLVRAAASAAGPAPLHCLPGLAGQGAARPYTCVHGQRQIRTAVHLLMMLTGYLLLA
jgi:hypothetical protein